MTDFPRSLIEFQQRFGDEAACAHYLAAARWPDGFACPGCGGNKAWRLATKAWTYECAGCRRQTSVTAGTIMHHSKLPLTVWFWAAYLMATHSNGISALQLQRQLALGSYKSAWLICAKLRRSMLAPGRSLLAGLVEVDETEIICRSKNDPLTGGGGRSHQGKMLVVGAVEVLDGGAGPGRIRLSQVPDYTATSLHAFVAANLAPGATAKTDGWSGYPGATGVTHDPHVVGKMAISSFPGSTASSPTSRSGLWASTTGCAASISNPTSMNLSSASTAAGPGTPRSDPCSASPPHTSLVPTKC
jgi:predicted RNA-binding Zn-ribbon protein involved in translation (DUF1610 family)